MQLGQYVTSVESSPFSSLLHSLPVALVLRGHARAVTDNARAAMALIEALASVAEGWKG